MPLLKKLNRSTEPDYRFVLSLADLHTFHACGLVPHEFVTSAGNVLVPNEFQRYLLECYDHLLGRLPERIDALLLMGDMNEGQNLAEDARGLSETDPTWQARGTHQLLGPILERVGNKNGHKNVYMVSGSRYHVGRMASTEELLGQMIDAQPKGEAGHRVWPWRHLMIGNVLFDLGHHQSFTIRYRSMPLEREYSFAMERLGRRRERAPSDIVIMRAHTHAGFRVWREYGAHCISLPCFKLQDWFAQSSRTPNRLVPDNLGAVGIKIFKEPVDETLVRIIPYLYEHPGHEVEIACE
jgi:hypothetical protein